MTEAILKEAIAGEVYKQYCAHPEWDDAKTVVEWLDYGAILTALREAGFAVVPVEPTEGMITAGEYVRLFVTSGPDTVWKAMLKAAQGGADE